MSKELEALRQKVEALEQGTQLLLRVVDKMLEVIHAEKSRLPKGEGALVRMRKDEKKDCQSKLERAKRLLDVHVQSLDEQNQEQGAM